MTYEKEKILPPHHLSERAFEKPVSPGVPKYGCASGITQI